MRNQQSNRVQKPALGNRICIFPIPYSLHCSIVPDSGEALFFMSATEGHLSSIKLIANNCKQLILSHIKSAAALPDTSLLPEPDGSFILPSIRVEAGDRLILRADPGSLDIWLAFLFYPNPETMNIIVTRRTPDA